MTELPDDRGVVTCFVTVGRNLSQPCVEHACEDQSAEQHQDRKADTTVADHSHDAIGWWTGEQEPQAELTAWPFGNLS